MWVGDGAGGGGGGGGVSVVGAGGASAAFQTLMLSCEESSKGNLDRFYLSICVSKVCNLLFCSSIWFYLIYAWGECVCVCGGGGGGGGGTGEASIWII